MEPVDRRLVFSAHDIGGERLGRVKQADPEPLATAVRFWDQRAAWKMLTCCINKHVRAGDQHGARRTNAGRLERGVLAGLADLEVERARAVDDPPAVPG